MITEFTGSNSEEQFLKPSSVIVLTVLEIYLLSLFPISAGVSHCTTPPQNLLTFVSGVPPCVTRHIAERGFSSHPGVSRNSGKRSLGVAPRGGSWVISSVSMLLLIRTQPGDLAPGGALLQQRNQVVHQGQLLLGAGLPAQPERGQQVAQLLAVEDHTLQDAVDKGL